MTDSHIDGYWLMWEKKLADISYYQPTTISNYAPQTFWYSSSVMKYVLPIVRTLLMLITKLTIFPFLI